MDNPVSRIDFEFCAIKAISISTKIQKSVKPREIHINFASLGVVLKSRGTKSCTAVDDSEFSAEAVLDNAADSTAAITSAPAAGDIARSEVLVSAMKGLYQLMAERNRALTRARDALSEANASLEARVRDRTADLMQALDEVEHARARVIVAEKMSAIGRLAAGVAHEINNPLGFVQSNLTTLGRYTTRMATLTR